MNFRIFSYLKLSFKKMIEYIVLFFLKIKPYLSYGSYIEHVNNTKRWNESIAYLAEFSLKTSENKIDLKGDVLIDATWENACYWFRYSLFRKSLSLNTHNEIGLIGKYNNKKIRKILSYFGITKLISTKITDKGNRICKKSAQDIVNSIKCPEDILKKKWPLNIPSALIYDEILLRQRLAIVDINHYRFFFDIHELLSAIYQVEKIFNENNIALVIVSHIAPFTQSALIWKAIEKKIPVIFLYSDFGTLRMLRINNPRDQFRFSNAPNLEEFNLLTEQQKDMLQKVGSSYIKKRINGCGDDVGSKYAYKNPTQIINKSDLCKKFNWPIDRPIVTIYASKWFDTPHVYGMKNFRDFLDWIEVTIEAALKNKSVSWLLKAHPCDKWYGGLTLKDIIPESISDHICHAEENWNGKYLIQIVDGLITMHGTAGIEYSCLEKPVLCADEGWYGAFDFVKVAASRSEYIDLLEKNWWNGFNTKSNKLKSEIFSGCFFGMPKEQGNFIIPDDLIQDEFYSHIKTLIADNYKSIQYEQKMIYKWFQSKESSYHSYKIRKSSSYKTTI